MKLLFVTTGLGIGGAERQVVDLSDELSSRGVEVIIAYILEPVLLKPKDPRVKLVTLGGSKSLIGILRALLNLGITLKKLKPDVVHSHMFHANLLSRLVRIFVGIPFLVSTAHSTDEGGKVRMLAYRFTNFLCDIFTNVSIEAVKSFSRKGASSDGKMLVVHNGIQVERFQSSDFQRNRLRHELGISSKRVFLNIGRLEAAKNQKCLVEAFAFLINEKYQHLHLLFVGEGSLRPQLEKKVEDLGIQDDVTFVGSREDIPSILSASDFFVLSSVTEGLPLVLAEAMASKKVVIATDVGGVGELLGSSGFIVPANDCSSLVDAMVKVMELTANEYIGITSSAYDRVKSKFDIKNIASRWLEIYKY